MCNIIKDNLVSLTENICDTEKVLLYLVQNKIFSLNDREEVLSQTTKERKNEAMLFKLLTKDENTINVAFPNIFRATNNEFCAAVIEGSLSQPFHCLQHPKILKEKWWPTKVTLIESLYKRKCEDKFLIEVLHEKLGKDESQMLVICESETASKYSGMGGVGKTLTATWYANHYEVEYDHIIWIECEEDSLIRYFKRLARDIEVDNRNEIDETEELARECFYNLRNFKCLIIFDNADSYKCNKAMKKLLLQIKNYNKKIKNLYCLITSRSRDWGVENVGYGKIPDFQLDIFSGQESWEFFDVNLNRDVRRTENEIAKLCTMLDNLPLALQLALSALNSKQINLQKYIHETSVHDLEKIVNAEFDDYEKTINRSIQVSLDLISKEENGKTALCILQMIGYLRPGDVPVAFFKQAFDLDDLKINKAIKSLIKYSLVSERKIANDEKELVSSLTVHRLLQQVLRLNGQETEVETLKQIFIVDGFEDYKLLPYIKYASDELKEEFPKLKAEFIDQERLQRLLKEKNWDEAERLAELIHQVINTDVTLFNFSMCLQTNGQLTKAREIVEELNQKIEEGKIFEKHSLWANIGILHWQRADQLTKELVRGHLLVLNWILNDMEKANVILRDKKSLLAVKTSDSLNIFLQMASSLPVDTNYTLRSDDHSRIHLEFDKTTKKIVFERSLSSDLQLPVSNVDEMVMGYVTIRDENGEKMKTFDLLGWIPPNLKAHSVNSYDSTTKFALSSDSEKLLCIREVSLQHCLLKLKSGPRLHPKKLTLQNVSFFKDEVELSEVTLNDILEIHQIDELKLSCHPSKQNMRIELGGEFVTMEYLELINVNISQIDKCQWRVNKLVLGQVGKKHFNEKTNMNINEITFYYFLIDISFLPETLTTLVSWTTTVESKGTVHLPNLKKLELNLMDMSCLPQFALVKLTHVTLGQMKEINVDLLPATIKYIKISSLNFKRGMDGFVGGRAQLKKLILEYLSMDEVNIVLQHLEAEQLVISNCFESPYVDYTWMNISLMSQIKSIALARYIHRFDESSMFSKGKEAHFFLFEKGIKKPIAEEEFNKFLEF